MSDRVFLGQATMPVVIDETISSTSTNPVENKAISAALGAKQDTLVSGTNIKTVNGNSLVGSGDVSIDSLPSQTGQSGKFLTTDGTDALWEEVDALPSQTGQSGKFLTTDGTDASWAPISGNFLPSTGGTMSPATGERDVRIEVIDSNENSMGELNFTQSSIGDNTVELISKGAIDIRADEDGSISLDVSGGNGSINLSSDTGDINLDTQGDVNINGNPIKSLPDQTGQDGKFLTTDGTDASWTTISALQNTATGTDSLTVLGTASSQNQSINIGTGSTVSLRAVAIGNNSKSLSEEGIAVGYASSNTGTYSVTIGGRGSNKNYGATCNSQNCVVIGASAKAEASVYKPDNAVVIGEEANTNQAQSVVIGTRASATGGVRGIAIGMTASTSAQSAIAIGMGASSRAQYAIQLGLGTNSTANTLSVGLDGSNNYQLLDSTGKIPSARMPITVADTSLSNLTNAGNIVGAGLGMPSSTYTDLTIGADGTQYTAPANGYVNFACLAGTMLQLYNLTAGSLFSSVQVANSSALGIWLPVKKGDIFSIYSIVTTPLRLRFHYAEGSKSEAN